MSMLDHNPYKGPYPFERGDLLFGRDREVKTILSLIVTSPAVLLYAPSGAGKTSLINARLCPDLDKIKGFAVLPPARVVSDSTRESNARNIYIFNTLLYLDPEEKLGSLEKQELEKESLADFLRRKYSGCRDRPRILIFDQFEEILTGYPERRRDREDFFLQVRESLVSDPQLNVLFVMREDHIAGIDRYSPLLPGQLRTRFHMDRLNYDAAVVAIRGPAEANGRPFADGVVEQLVDNLRQERGPGEQATIPGEFVEPVQLQVVCRQLWEKLGHCRGVITQTDVADFGDVDQALEIFYERAIGHVSHATAVREAQIRRWFGETLIVSSARIRGQVPETSEETGGLPKSAVDALVDQHLIRAEHVRNWRWFELVHDRFIDPILESNSRWFAKSRRRNLVIVCSAVALLAAIGLSWALRSIHHVRMARAEQVSQLALDTLNDHPPTSLWLALRAVRIAQTVNQRLTPLNRDALRQALQASRAKLVRSLPAGDMDHQLTLDGTGDRLSILDPGGGVAVWDVESGRQLLTLPDQGHSATASVLGPSGSLAAAFDDATVQLWDVDEQELLHTFPTEVEVFELLFSPDETQVAATSFEGTVELWDAGSSDSIGSLSDPEGSLIAGAFGPEGKWLASTSDTGMLMIWDLETGVQKHTFPSGEDNAASFSSSGISIASAGSDGVDVWDATTGMLPGLRLPQESQIYSLAFAWGDRFVVFVSTDGTAQIWDLRANQSQIALPGDKDLNVRPTFSQDGRRMAIAREQGKTEIWELIFAEVPQLLPGHAERINAVAVSRDGKLLASGSDDRIVKVWDLASDQPTRDLRGHQARVNSVAFSPHLPLLATASDDRTVRIWDLESGHLERTRAGHSNNVNAVAWSPDGESIASASTGGEAWIWDAHSDELRLKLDLPEEESVLDIAFSPDGKLLATAGGVAEEKAGIARIWDSSSGRERARLTGHANLVTAVAFSPDGELLATGSDDKTVRIWTTRAAKLQQIFTDHSGTVTGVVFAPNGSGLATCDVNGTVILWNLDTAEKESTISGRTRIRDLAFAPGGQRLMTAGGDGRIRIEPLAVEDLIRLAEERTGVRPAGAEVEN